MGETVEYEKFESYSSYGEDAMLNGVIKRLSWIMQKNLFDQNTYIDIGSFHPVKESNTYFLYKNGWAGTLVDPNSYFNVLVHELRPHDILYNCAVDIISGTREFYMFGDTDSSNTLSKEFADRKIESQHTGVSWTAQVPTKTLNDIINIHLEYFQRTPFLLNIDIEGLDLDVIKTYSHDVRIPFVMVEDDTMRAFTDSPIRQTMAEKGYLPISTTFLTTLYIDEQSKYYPNLKKIGMFEK
jgi:FkbM family methyltransferase